MTPNRRPTSRRPAIEGLEARALLSTLARGPATGRPAAAYIRQFGDHGNLGGNQGHLGGGQGNLAHARGNLGGAPQGGGLDQQLGLRNVKVRFRNRGDGEIKYELRFDSGGYRFRQEYELDVDRRRDANGDGGLPGGGGLTMVDALDLFVAGLTEQLSTGSGFDGQGGDHGDERTDSTGGRFRRNGGGNYEYEQEYSDGIHDFESEYSFKVNRIRGRNDQGGNLGGLTALDAVDLFLTTLQQRVGLGAQGGNFGGGRALGLR